MATRLYRGAVFALYQLSLVLAITLLPVALVARRAGITLPIHRAVERLGDEYEATADGR